MNKDRYAPLFVKTKTGKINIWSVWADEDYMVTRWGVLGGKLQTSRKAAYPTNKGKSNQRNAMEQAIFDAGSLWRQKKDEGYSESPDDAKEAKIFLPMLAHKLENLDKLKGKKFDYQKKLDGVRCLAYWENGAVQLMSRGGKSYTVKHVQEELKQLLPAGYILDGELYAEGFSCQTVTSFVKKHKEGSEKLVYNVFDFPSHGGMWDSRREALKEYFKGLGAKSIKLVETIENATLSDIDKYHDGWVTEGYEGLIVRLHSGLYEYGERSRFLLKFKKFDDAEFLVVGIEPGEGKLNKAAVFTLKNDLTDDEFCCIFAGTLLQREEQLRNANHYINQQLTVRFFGRTNDGIPRFPVGKAFRSKSDL
jgi:ATP-dependent DNA ligase